MYNYWTSFFRIHKHSRFTATEKFCITTKEMIVTFTIDYMALTFITSKPCISIHSLLKIQNIHIQLQIFIYSFVQNLEEMTRFLVNLIQSTCLGFRIWLHLTTILLS